MAAPQTGLTSCQIGDIGYPRTVHANPYTTILGECSAFLASRENISNMSHKRSTYIFCSSTCLNILIF